MPAVPALPRLLAGVLALLIAPGTLLAQANGSNFDVMSNGLDVTYIGLGAGGAQTPSDGLGVWMAGEDMKGTVKTYLGDWGYRQSGWRDTVCIPNAGTGTTLAIRFPLITFVELDGRNGHVGDVFTTPNCDAGGLLGIVSGVVPYGVPTTAGVATASASFLLAGYPSFVLTPGLPSPLLVLLPNNGLQPSGHGGTATLIGLASLPEMLINSTGFCWTVDFTWMPSALASLDDIDGWWRYSLNSPDGNQYWGMSNDELNGWQSRTLATDNTAASLISFTANLDYVWHSKQVDPSVNVALHPAGFNGTGVYYATTTDAGGGNPGPGVGTGAGFDLGRHVARSDSATLGPTNPNTGLVTQDPSAASIPGLLPTLAVATWNNEDYDGDGSPLTPPTGGWRLTWLTLDWDATFGINPAVAGEIVVFNGSVRVPTSIPAGPGGINQLITSAFWPIFVHNTVNHDGSGLWPDPDGFPSGFFGTPGVNGATVHVPLSIGTVCIGFPITLILGSNGMLGPSGPITWIPDPLPGYPGIANASSTTRQLGLLD